MSEKKPEPLIRPTPRQKCPVCGYASYSIGGIHPQCHGLKADRQRRQIRAAEVKAKASAAEPSQNDGVANCPAPSRS